MRQVEGLSSATCGLAKYTGSCKTSRQPIVAGRPAPLISISGRNISMKKQTLTAIALAAMAAAVISGPAHSQDAKLQRLQASPNVTLKQKLGYWVECRYTGLGEECYYVYAKPKGSNKLQRIKVKDSKLQKKKGYYVECRYTGLGQECYYVYAKVKPKS